MIVGIVSTEEVTFGLFTDPGDSPTVYPHLCNPREGQGDRGEGCFGAQVCCCRVPDEQLAGTYECTIRANTQSA